MSEEAVRPVGTRESSDRKAASFFYCKGNAPAVLHNIVVTKDCEVYCAEFYFRIRRGQIVL